MYDRYVGCRAEFARQFGHRGERLIRQLGRGHHPGHGPQHNRHQVIELSTNLREMFTVPGEGPYYTRDYSMLEAYTRAFAFTTKNLLKH